MLLPFPIGPHLEEKTLEGLSIIVCVRWMLFAPLALFVGVLASLLPAELIPLWQEWFINRPVLPFVLGTYLLLVGRDLWMVRRKIVKWDEERLRSQTVIKRLPQLLLIFVPLLLLQGLFENPMAAITWSLDMLWVFGVLSVFFYTVYFILLRSISKLPKTPAVAGFLLAIISSV